MIGMSSMAASRVFLVFLATATVLVPVFGFEFHVGGPEDWTKPDGNESVTYNDWAEQNRFRVGDTLRFKYENDSVLVVNRENYESCTVANPIFEFTDGDTVFLFDRHGFYYFISGEPGHCEAGQELVVRVMVHSRADRSYGPAEAPSPTEGAGDCSSSESIWAPSLNATANLSVASYYLLTALVGVLVILYLSM